MSASVKAGTQVPHPVIFPVSSLSRMIALSMEENIEMVLKQ